MLKAVITFSSWLSQPFPSACGTAPRMLRAASLSTSAPSSEQLEMAETASESNNTSSFGGGNTGIQAFSNTNNFAGGNQGFQAGTPTSSGDRNRGLLAGAIAGSVNTTFNLAPGRCCKPLHDHWVALTKTGWRQNKQTAPQNLRPTSPFSEMLNISISRHFLISFIESSPSLPLERHLSAMVERGRNANASGSHLADYHTGSQSSLLNTPIKYAKGQRIHGSSGWMQEMKCGSNRASGRLRTKYNFRDVRIQEQTSSG